MRHYLLSIVALVVAVNCNPAFTTDHTREVPGATLEIGASVPTTTTSEGETNDTEEMPEPLLDSLEITPPTIDTVYGEDVPQRVDSDVKTPQDVSTYVKTPQDIETDVKASQNVYTDVKTSQDVYTDVKTPQKADTSVQTLPVLHDAPLDNLLVDSAIGSDSDSGQSNITKNSNDSESTISVAQLLSNQSDDLFVFAKAARDRATSSASLEIPIADGKTSYSTSPRVAQESETSESTTAKIATEYDLTTAAMGNKTADLTKDPPYSTADWFNNKLVLNEPIISDIVDSRQKDHEILQSQVAPPLRPIEDALAQKPAGSLTQASQKSLPVQSSDVYRTTGLEFNEKEHFNELDSNTDNLLEQTSKRCTRLYERCLNIGILNDQVTCPIAYRKCLIREKLGRGSYLKRPFLPGVSVSDNANGKRRGLLSDVVGLALTLNSNLNDKLGETLASSIDQLIGDSEPKCTFKNAEQQTIKCIPEINSPAEKCPFTNHEIIYEPIKVSAASGKCEYMQAFSENLVAGLTKGLADGLTLGIGNALKDFTGLLTAALSKNLAEPLVKVIEGTVGTLDKSLGSVLASVVKVTDGLKLDRLSTADALGEVTGLLKTVLKPEVLKGIGPLVSNTVSGPLSSLPKVDNVLSGVTGLLKDAASNDLTKSLQNILGNTLGAVSKVTGTVSKPLELITDTVDNTVGLLNSLLSVGNLINAGSVPSYTIGGVGSAANAIPAGLLGSALPIASAALPLASNAVSSTVPNVLNSVLQTASNTANSVASVANPVSVLNSVVPATNPINSITSILPAPNPVSSVSSVVPAPNSINSASSVVPAPNPISSYSSVVPATSTKPGGLLGLLGKRH